MSALGVAAVLLARGGGSCSWPGCACACACWGRAAAKVKTELGAHAGRAMLAEEPWQDRAPTLQVYPSAHSVAAARGGCEELVVGGVLWPDRASSQAPQVGVAVMARAAALPR